MYTFETLDISHKDETVENTFFHRSDGSDHLALVLPGAGYTTQGPMLYYSIKALSQLGAEILSLEYGGVIRRSASRSPDERTEIFSLICLNALNASLKRRKYNRLTLIGKSLGTRGLASLSRLAGQWSYKPRNIEALWLTPLLTENFVTDEIEKLGSREFLAIGSCDEHYYKPQALQSLPRFVETLIIDGADHGLDIEGDVLSSTKALSKLTARIARFLNI